MKPELFFALATLLVLPFWLLMIGLPAWRMTETIVRSPLVLLPLPVLYAVLLAFHWPVLAYLIENPTLPGVALVLGRGEGALIGWVHFLALDFFVGRWIYLDSRQRGIHFLAMTPILWLTLLLGPVGLLLYIVLSASVGEPQETSAGASGGARETEPPGQEGAALSRTSTGKRKPG